jgi:hypothetical protein
MQFVRLTCFNADILFVTSSDADSDVLADYVLALIQSDLPDNEIRDASIGELNDFLRESP